MMTKPAPPEGDIKEELARMASPTDPVLQEQRGPRRRLQGDHQPAVSAVTGRSRALGGILGSCVEPGWSQFRGTSGLPRVYDLPLTANQTTRRLGLIPGGSFVQNGGPQSLRPSAHRRTTAGSGHTSVLALSSENAQDLAVLTPLPGQSGPVAARRQRVQPRPSPTPGSCCRLPSRTGRSQASNGSTPW
jgi:hypothetical protein